MLMSDDNHVAAGVVTSFLIRLDKNHVLAKFLPKKYFFTIVFVVA